MTSNVTGRVTPGFGRMFQPSRTPLRFPYPTVLGALKGPMDRGEGHGDDSPLPIPADALGWGDNPDIPAAFTYLGQFIDHDISFDRTSRLGEPRDPWQIPNERAPTLGLDSVYGRGPSADHALYDPTRPGRLLVGSVVDDPATRMDLPRDAEGRLLLGDPRNAENFIVSQLHVAFLRFHNAVLSMLQQGAGDDGFRPGEPLSERARRLVRWHYQWIVVHEYLPMLVAQELIDEVRVQGGRLYLSDQQSLPFMPVEFSAAAFRFGHSQVQASYVLGRGFQARVFPADPLFPPWNDPSTPRQDLRGGPASRADLIDWNFLLSMGRLPASGTRFSARISRKIGAPMFKLPRTVTQHLSTGWALDSLPARTLQRQIDFALPSGRSAAEQAQAAGCKEIVPLTPDEIWQGAEFQPFLDCEAPLWFYLLAEAERHAKPGSKVNPPHYDLEGRGQMLGPLGQRIVAEVLIGLLRMDPESYLNAEALGGRAWLPTLGDGRNFGLADLLRLAEMKVAGG